MQTIRIDDIEIENFIQARYGDDTQSLLNDFISFVKWSLDDGYSTISKAEARKRVTQAVEELRKGEAVLLSQEEYDKEMKAFLKSL